MSNPIDMLAIYARSYLINYDYPSRQEQTDLAMRKMYEALKEYYEPQPPSLGVNVADKVETKSMVR